MRAAHRRQQQQQQQSTTPKSQRRSITNIPSSNRRAKSSATMANELATSSTGRFEPPTVQATSPQPAIPGPKELTLSERLASIGRITSTLETTQDDTPTNNESVQTKK